MAYYALAILKQKGVTAYPVLARTRSAGPVFESFPSSQFNHVVIAVELDESSMELNNIEIAGKPYLLADLTDRYTSLPQISSSLENTKVLPVTETGSPLVTVPISSPESNAKSYELDLTYHSDHSMTGTISETLTGNNCAREKRLRAEKDKKEKDKMYRDWLHDLIPGAVLKAVSIKEETDNSITTEVTFSASNIGTEINDELYVGPNIINASTKNFRKRKRETDLLYSWPYIQEVNVSMTIDPSFEISKCPKPKSGDTDFFSYTTSAHSEGQNVQMSCSFRLKNIRIKADQYKAFRKAYRKYLKAVRSQVVLKE
jgi:hypothetical protein